MMRTRWPAAGPGWLLAAWLAACGGAGAPATDDGIPDAAAHDAADPGDLPGDPGADAPFPPDTAADGAEDLDLPGSDDGLDAADVPPPRTSSAFEAKASVEQVHVRDGAPGAVVQVVDAQGTVFTEAAFDDLGSRVFRKVPPGRYTVRPADDPDDFAGPFEVLSVEASLPDESFYAGQVLQPGYGYLKVRDGTLLSYFVTLPGPPEEGPYPTVVNYSGYSPSRPGRSLGGQVEPYCDLFPVLCDAPDDPSNLVAALMGFATVGVNMRGTGCSDGAYDYFETLQTLDGYDVVEIVAHQPWVKGHRVGMVGLSFPGISQLFVAAARPPGLAAIAPQSVIADSGTSCLMPGGIYNDGFAYEWHRMVLDRARPWDPGWVKDVVAAGDALCDRHQRMHGQARDAIDEALVAPYYTDEVAKPVDPTAWVDRIQVPVFLTGQWQDEQTGPHFAALMDRFSGAPVTRFVVTNGVHPDGFAPQTLVEWGEFLHLFVARDVPYMSDDLRALATVFMGQVFGAPLAFPASRFQEYPDHASALAAWTAEAPVRVIFESGASPDAPAGAPQGRFEQRFASWPIPGTVADRWFFHPGGALDADTPPAGGGASAFVHDPEAGQRTILPSGNIDGLQPPWVYPPLADGKAVAFLTEPLAEDRVMAGFGSVDLWIRTDALDVDLEVNLTDVRPDGRESYVQSGWLRASRRVLRDDATELRPIKTHREADVTPLVPGEWTAVRVELMPFAHVFRAGSRVRISVDTPGDSRARWRFRILAYDTPPAIEIGHDAAHPSSVALPWVPEVDVPGSRPACNALRGQPCRDYVPPAAP